MPGNGQAASGCSSGTFGYLRYVNQWSLDNSAFELPVPVAWLQSSLLSRRILRSPFLPPRSGRGGSLESEVGRLAVLGARVAWIRFSA
jgi:hypothetical protein